MKFSFSPVVLLAALFTPSFAAPTEAALSKRDVSLSFSFGYTNIGISIRDVETTVTMHKDLLGKRTLDLYFTLQLTNSLIAIKRGTEEADEQLSKRFEEYNVVVTSPLPPANGLSGRSTDPNEGRQVTVYTSDAFVQAANEIGVTQSQMPQYVGQNLYATDPSTGKVYQLAPASNAQSGIAIDIAIDLDYEPASS